MLRKYLLAFSVLALLLQSCGDDKHDPVLKLNNAQQITAPATGTSYVLTAATADDVLQNITWTATDYSLNNVGKVYYNVELDVKGNDFATPILLGTTNDLNREVTVGDLNGKLLLAGYTPEVATEFELRVSASVEQKTETVYSNVVGLTITPFSTVVNVKPLYLLGDGTLAGWDNTAALPMTYLDGGRYEIVTTLAGAGKFMKVLSALGQWAPQWGTDGTGTSTGGPLVYRPTEQVADPSGIPTPDVVSQYKIIVDTALLTYEIFEYGDIYLLGNATAAGWDNAVALPFTKVSDGKYSINATLVGGAGNFWKIIDERGQWAPQWGTDANGTSDAGTLVLRPTESDPDPAAIPAPTDNGDYKIEVDIVNLTYTVTKL